MIGCCVVVGLRAGAATALGLAASGSSRTLGPCQRSRALRFLIGG